MGGHVTWAGVALAAVTTLPAILAAVVALLNHKALRTANGKTVGEMVTEVHGEASNQGTAFDTHHGG